MSTTVAGAARKVLGSPWTDRPAQKSGSTLTFGGRGALAEAYRVAYGKNAPDGGETLFLAYALDKLGRTPKAGDTLEIPPLDDLVELAPREKLGEAQRLVKDGVTATVNSKRRKALRASEKDRKAPANAGATLEAPVATKPKAKPKLDVGDIASRPSAVRQTPGKLTRAMVETELKASLDATRGKPAGVRVAELMRFVDSRMSTDDLRSLLQTFPSGADVDDWLHAMLDGQDLGEGARQVGQHMMRSFAMRAIGAPLSEAVAGALKAGGATIDAIGRDPMIASPLARDLRAATREDASTMADKLGLSASLIDNLRKAPNDAVAAKLLQTECGRLSRDIEALATHVRNRSGDLQLYKLAPAITARVLAHEGTLAPKPEEENLSKLEVHNAAQEAIRDDIKRFDRGKEPYIAGALATAALVTFTVTTGGVGFAGGAALGALAEVPMIAVGAAEANDLHTLSAAKLAQRDAGRTKMTETLVAAAVSAGLGIVGGQLLKGAATKSLAHDWHRMAELFIEANIPVPALLASVAAGELVSAHKLSLTPEAMMKRLNFHKMVDKLAGAESKLVTAWQEHAPEGQRTAASARNAILTFGALYADELADMSEAQTIAHFTAFAREPTRYAAR